MTAYFIDYDPRTGRVLGHGSVTDEVAEFHFAMNSGHVEMDGPLDDWQNVRVVNGALVWCAVPPSEFEVKLAIRSELTNTDKTQVPDYPISAEEREQWRTYRQALRDFTGNPAEIPDDPKGRNIARVSGWVDPQPPAGLVLPNLVIPSKA